MRCKSWSGVWFLLRSSCVGFILSSPCVWCWWLLCVTLWRSEGDTLLFFSLESGLLAAANRNHQQHPVTTSAVATPAIVPSTAGTTLKSWKTNLLKFNEGDSTTVNNTSPKEQKSTHRLFGTYKKGRKNIHIKLNVLIFHKNALPLTWNFYSVNINFYT